MAMVHNGNVSSSQEEPKIVCHPSITACVHPGCKFLEMHDVRTL